MLPEDLKIEPTIPTRAPSTVYEFEKTWVSLKTDIPSFYLFFKTIEPRNYKQLFKNALDTPFLSTIISTLHRCYVKDSPQQTLEVLENLLSVHRMDVLLMLLPAVQKQELLLVFEEILAQCGDDRREYILRLKSAYKLK